jgi:subtilisin family serine protease
MKKAFRRNAMRIHKPELNKRVRLMIVYGLIVRAVLCFLAVTGLVFVGLPISAQQQEREPTTILASQAKKANSKLSSTSFSMIKATADQKRSAMAGQNNTQDVGMKYLFLSVEFTNTASRQSVFTDQKQSRIQGAAVLTATEQYADIFLWETAALEALKRNPNVRWFEDDHVITVPPPPETKPSDVVSQAIAETIVRGGFHGLTGKNVIIAVLDSGIDFRHADFISYDPQGRPTSRISFFWDTATTYQPGRGSVAPLKYPNGTSIGTLYTKDQLTAELRSGRETIPATDLDGHGTACASIAAGNGNADKGDGGLKRKEVEGVAPDAEIIGVRLGKVGLENAYLINAICEWLDKVAGQRPLVVSGSFGGHGTGHDGQSIRERQLNARFPLSRAGRAVVFAAGNEGGGAMHAVSRFDKTPKLVAWSAARPTIVTIYFNSNDPGIAFAGIKAAPLSKELLFFQNALTNQNVIELPVNAGLGGIWFENKSGSEIEAQLYFPLQDGQFSPETVSNSYLVGSPGTMSNAITVGSFDWNDSFHSRGRLTIERSAMCGTSIEIGWLSCYSSPGPTRGGAVKPEIVAPGQWFTSANAKNNGVTVAAPGEEQYVRVDTTGNYRLMNGTSAATPYTAGIIALMFEKKPTLTFGEARDLIIRNASKSGLNPLSRSLPNNNWGYGKLDLPAIERIVALIM